MGLLSASAGIVGGILTPAALLVSSLALLPYVKPHRILRPRSFLCTLKDLPEGSRSSPLLALSVALTGTLGVGSITGVASALAAGGPGAVFWMILGSLAVIPVKYAEVSLAVRFRRIGDAVRFRSDPRADLLRHDGKRLFHGQKRTADPVFPAVVGLPSRGCVCLCPGDVAFRRSDSGNHDRGQLCGSDYASLSVPLSCRFSGRITTSG